MCKITYEIFVPPSLPPRKSTVTLEPLVGSTHGMAHWTREGKGKNWQPRNRTWQPRSEKLATLSFFKTARFSSNFLETSLGAF